MTVPIEHLGSMAPASKGPLVEPDISDLLAQLDWDDARPVAECYSTDLPLIAKVEGEQHLGVAQINIGKPFLLYTGRKCAKVLVSNVYWEDSKQAYVSVGPRIVIPLNFNGTVSVTFSEVQIR